MASIKNLQKTYRAKKSMIDRQLKHFSSVFNMKPSFIFKELCFCILTPQSKAKTCDHAIEKIYDKGILFTGSEKEIAHHLKSIRFKNNKAKYIVLARRFFTDRKTGQITIKKKISSFEKKPQELRTYLVKNIKGIGMKEASHFLRNIGKGNSLTILDRHIIKNLKKYNVIESMPESITVKKYLETENRMKEFSKISKIPVDALDLLFWSDETGQIFK